MDVIIEEEAASEDVISLGEEAECLCTPKSSSTSNATSESTLEEIRRLFEEHRYVGPESSFYRPTDLDRVTVKFMMETGACFVEEFFPVTTVSKVKDVLSEAFQIPPKVIVLTLNGHLLSNESSLSSLGLITSQIAIMEITSNNPLYPVLLSNVPEEMRNKRIIRVRVPMEYGEYKDVRVIIVRKLAKKPFLGGLRHKETAIEYHHAFSQTPPFPQKPFKEKNERDTQTAWWRDGEQMTVCHRATQNYRRDYYIPWKGDVIKTAKEYVTAEEQERRRDLERKVGVIQRYLRAWLIRRMINRASEEQRRRIAWEAEQERLRIEARETRLKADIVKSAFPRRRADFEVLYSTVEQWRSAEVNRIKTSQKAQATKCAEYALVLEKEVKNLFEIEKQRLSVKEERLRRKELEVINKCAEPITWTGYKGMTVSMDTLRNQRARELKELYLSLCREEAPLESRVDLLMAIKDALVTHRQPLVDDIIELVNRECDLLVRGLHTDQLEALRARLRSLFLQLVKTPEFNPEMAKYSLEYSYKGLEFSLFLCGRCQNLLPREKFLPGNRDEQLQFCRSCRWLEKASLSRTDLTPYSFMLRALRRDERRRCCFSSVAFIMQESDFHYLVTNIWHAQSALSENKNVRDLRMSRWEVGKDWAPWNCILLSDNEARAHVRVADCHKLYVPAFVEEVGLRHLLARQRFRNLDEAGRRFRHSGAWELVRDDIIYRPPSPEADAFQP